MMKHIANISIIKKFAAALLAVLALVSLVSCDSRVDDAGTVMSKEFSDIWEKDTDNFTKIEYFEYDTIPCYNIEFDTVNDEGEPHHVNAIIVSNEYNTVDKYIHSVDFERTSRNKEYHQAYLDAVEAGTVVVFTAEEVAEVQAKVEELVK